MDRRTFGKGMAVATTLMAADALADETALGNLPIVDTHQHLWDLDRFKLAWLDKAPPILNRTYLTSHYLEAAEGLNIVKCVYLEVDLAVEQQTDEGRYVIEISQDPQQPTVAGVISGRCDEEGFAPYIAQFKDSPYIKGVRHILQAAPKGVCLKPQFIQSVQLLGEMGMSFDLTIRPRDLDDGLQLVKQCPGTLFVVDHCGVADPKAFMPAHRDQAAHDAEAWKRSMGQLADQRNTVCKISGIVAEAPASWETGDLAPIVNHCLEEFGPDRVMFGGDWPVCLLGAELGKWVGALKEIVAHRPLDQQQKLFAQNAMKHYRLPN